jgi:hypothetical protein
MDHYLGVAKELGISNQEVGAVQSVVMAVSAGRVRAQFREVRLKKKTREREARREKESAK